MRRAWIVGRTIFVIALACADSSALALWLEPLPGASPQSTRIGAFFEHEVGVVVRGEAGDPVVGVPVTFAIEGEAVAFWAGYYGHSLTTLSDEHGIAIIPWAYGINPGRSQVRASAPGADGFTFDFTVTDGMIWWIKNVAGHGQAAAVGMAYPVRWTVQAVDEKRNPVPYACVSFWDGEPWNPGGKFADVGGYLDMRAAYAFPWEMVIAKADENGVAVAPVWIANYNQGNHWALAGACRGHENQQSYVPHEVIHYNNTPAQSDH